MVKRRPGEIRDAILDVLSTSRDAMPVREIEREVIERVDSTSPSSVRSYLRLNTPDLFFRPKRAFYMLKEQAAFYSPDASHPEETDYPKFEFGHATLFHGDCFDWLRGRQANSIHAVVTDPPYGLVEYSSEQQRKLRAGRGGVWRLPPSFDGARRSPVPRFTVLKSADLEALHVFFSSWARVLIPALVPGASVVVASNPLVSYVVSGALSKAGLERRGEIVRLVMTMRGGDRPKAAHEDFPAISVMPRSMWEPWLVFRKPLEGRVQDNLRKWKTGGFRRPSPDKPFGDVIESSPTGRQERSIAPHPTLKPQAFLRQLVRAALPLGEGVILDPFAGAGSTLAAAEAVGYESIGIEKDKDYFSLACSALPRLAALCVKSG
ncbi:MAG TPA: DNA methyltransferase [Dehalococcoidia bacterium]|nr:DNA methyltransferase [Dehalococcoidia bacterium]